MERKKKAEKLKMENKSGWIKIPQALAQRELRGRLRSIEGRLLQSNDVKRTYLQDRYGDGCPM